MEETRNVTETDVVVIGAGISGLVAGKCLREDGFKVVILERSGEIGGLWNYRENDYGVMRCTHINVSKYNYCFSDFPFPDDATDYPHHTEMVQYIVDYAKHFSLMDLLQFHTKVIKVTQKGERWEVVVDRVEEDGQVECGETRVIVCRFLAIATGHHAKPSRPCFPGEASFTGEIIHSVDYKNPLTNGFVGKRVLIVGIGNSAVDAAVDCATVGRCKSVHISTRSGAWIIPNYVFGFPTDLYACRAFFLLPWKLANVVFESVIKLNSGNPRRWGLNPKMKALQTQPTVSPTLIHHIQRKNITIVSNITRANKRISYPDRNSNLGERSQSSGFSSDLQSCFKKIEGDTVQFVNGEKAVVDKIVYCTGYKIDLPYLSEDLLAKVLDRNTNSINLYKNVFSPAVGPRLGFIGFVQPASGGVLTMSEIQARWFGQVCREQVSLPPSHLMEQDIRQEKTEQSERWYASARHTIQRDPIVYNDQIAALFGAKPGLLKHPALAWRLLLGTCGAAQWRLQGPGKWSGAARQVLRAPVTDLMKLTGGLLLIFLLLLLYLTLHLLFCVF